MGAYRGIKISKSVTNLFPLSRKSVTRTISVTSGQVYTCSVRGKRGSVMLSGAGTGSVTDGSPRTFTASSNSLTVTVTGYLKHIQVEAGSIATAEVWTSNTPATKSADAPAPLINLQSGQKLGISQGAIIIDFSGLLSETLSSPYLDIIKQNGTVTSEGIRLVTHTAGTGILKIRVYTNSLMTERILAGVNLLNGGKVGLSWSASELKIFHNGALVDTISQSIPVVLDTIAFSAAGNEVIYKGIYLFATRPTDANMLIGTNY